MLLFLSPNPRVSNRGVLLCYLWTPLSVSVRPQVPSALSPHHGCCLRLPIPGSLVAFLPRRVTTLPSAPRSSDSTSPDRPSMPEPTSPSCSHGSTINPIAASNRTEPLVPPFPLARVSRLSPEYFCIIPFGSLLYPTVPYQLMPYYLIP